MVEETRSIKRRRVTRACDYCKRRKIKCTGLQPCEFCSRVGRDCTYESVYARGKAPTILPAASSPQSVDNPARNDGPLRHPRPAAGDSTALSGSAPTGLTPTAAAGSTSQSHVSPQAGLHGHYIGPASGVSFLQRVQQRLGHAQSFSKPDDIFTFGDAPFDRTDTDLFSCLMLPREVAQRFLDRYFDFAMPTYRFLHRPTIQSWFTELYDTYGTMRDTERASAKIALVLMVLAHGRVYLTDAEQHGPSDLSLRLYQAADLQLSKESGPIRLTSIQARLTQCYFLLTQSHINHCWRAFGSVSHLILAVGLNRSRKAGVYANTNNIELECRRRTFWCAYALDVHLSVVLGRPQLFHDDDIDVELPSCIDDEELTKDHRAENTTQSGLSVMLAPIAHIKLARIVKRILRQLYSLASISVSQRMERTDDIASSLAEWRSDLDAFLDTDKFNASMFVPIVQRQRNVLNLTYWHAVILVHRPYLLKNMSGSLDAQMTTDEGMPSDDRLTQDSIQQCLSSAMNTVNAVNQMTQSRQMSRAFWIAAYFAFTASVVLYIYVIQSRNSDPDAYQRYLTAATQCQSHIASIADKGSLSERYLLLLEELRLEAIRQKGHAQDTPANVQTPWLQPENDTLANINANASLAPEDFNRVMPDHTAAYAEWDQFADLVTSGLGNLDAFFDDDPFGALGDYSSGTV